MSKQITSNIEQLEKKIGYVFKNKTLINLAITHSSFLKNNLEKTNYLLSYQRLEFLGDAVLQLIISDYIYKTYKEENEGELAKRRAGIVCGKNLSDIAENLNLKEHIILSTYESENFSRSKNSILEDVLEAIIGAIYIDGGMLKAKKFALKIFAPKLKETVDYTKDDPKSALQEWAQKKGLKIPTYEVVKIDGSQHEPHFTVKVIVEKTGSFIGTGKSKKIAEKQAALGFLEKFSA